MTKTKQNIIEMLSLKQNRLTEKIIENIDFFSEQELQEIYLILNQSDPEKLKEAWHYKNKQMMQTIDKINEIWLKLHKIEKEIIILEESKDESNLLQLEHNLNLAF